MSQKEWALLSLFDSGEIPINPKLCAISNGVNVNGGKRSVAAGPKVTESILVTPRVLKLQPKELLQMLGRTSN